MADDRMKVTQQQAALVFSDLIDSLIIDTATEAHRAARLGFDYKLNVEEEEEVRLAAHARAVVGDSGTIGTEVGNKHTVDVFGQTHPTIANEMFECMNCGRPIVAGRFAPHLEKCMGKGRKARIKASRNINASQQRRVRSSPLSSYGATGSASLIASRTPSTILEDSQRDSVDTNNGESEESHEDDEKDLSYGLVCPGKARSKKSSGMRKNKSNLTQRGVSGLVPVPLQVSPARASCSASVASIAEAFRPGNVAGLTVEVAVEQFQSSVSGRAQTSVDKALLEASKPLICQVRLKGRKVGERKKKLHQVLAGSPVVNYNGTRKFEEIEVSKNDDRLTRMKFGAAGGRQDSNLPNGLVGEVMSDSSSRLYGHGELYHLKGSTTEPCMVKQ